ncbi:methyltransferase [Streptomyces longispororuber]|uniref:Methyltransferase n=1 Tax=Streptomyces longispororuber TaxID=68230 RepID=A0A918Z7M4_9ACTN|nr:class I SAM-dependent methyltransferase [Streptomyces longispororuber]GHE39280.1 methyltransferase [Streptomyces longispororuber]
MRRNEPHQGDLDSRNDPGQDNPGQDNPGRDNPAPDDLSPYWNTNVARHRDILRAVPPGCRDALDVGCGDGLLARKLAGRAERVTGVDEAPEMIARARGLARGRPGLTFVEGDFLAADLPTGGYDFVCSVSAVHHMDFEAALTRMRELLCPGGTLVVVGLARSAGPAEWAVTVAAAPVVRLTKLVRRARTPDGMPLAAPRLSYGQVRAAAHRILPGVRYRRHVLRRYSLTWRKPGP